MREGPDISAVGALIGEPTRANMLTALLYAPALTAGELAREARITPQTASGHLSQLQSAGLLRSLRQGRHRYYALADHEIAEFLEQALGLASRLGHLRTRPGPKDPELRRARVCYDHLAGELAVDLFERFEKLGGFETSGGGLQLSRIGLTVLEAAGVRLDEGKARSRPLCRACLDWSERRSHLAGRAGAALLDRFIELDWARRSHGSRVVAITPAGAQAFATLFRDEPVPGRA